MGGLNRSSGGYTEGNAENSSLFSLSVLGAILAVYAYFTGWIYAYHFYRHFGISLYSLEIPLQHFYVFSYSVFTSFWGIVTIVVGLGVGYFLVLAPYRRWLVIPALLIAVPLCDWLASTQAEHIAKRVRHGYDSNIVRLYFKKDVAPLYPKLFLERNRHGVLRLLTHTKDRYFVLMQPGSDPDVPELPYGFVYHVSKEDLVLAAIDIKSAEKLKETGK